MLKKDERLRLKRLLSEAVPLLCKNSIGVQVESNFCVEAMIGITMDDCQVAVICFKETMFHDGKIQSHAYGTDEVVDRQGDVDCPQENDDDYVNDECQLIDDPTPPPSSFREGATSQSTSSNRYNSSSSLVDEGYKTRAWNTGTVKIEGNDETNVGNEQDLGEKYAEDSYESERGDCYDDTKTNIRAPQKNTQQERRNKNTQQQSQMIKEELSEEPEEEEEFQIDHQLGNAEDWGYPEDGYGGESTSYQMGGDNSASYVRAPKKMRFSTQPKPYNSRIGHISRPWKRGGALPPVSVPNYKRSTLSTGATNSQGGGSGGAGLTDALKKMCQTIASQAQVEQQFICHICNAKLANKPSLVTHIKGSHIAESLFQCEHCDKSFNWYMQLYRHKKRYHPTAVQNFGQQGAYEQSYQSAFDASS